MKTKQLQKITRDMNKRLSTRSTQEGMTDDEKTIAQLLVHIEGLNKSGLYNINGAIERAKKTRGNREDYHNLHIMA